MKKFILFIMLFLLLTSCKVQKIENSEQAFDYIKSMRNYISDIKVSFKNERNEESIFLRQYSSSNSIYRLDLEEERIYIYKDGKIFVNDIGNNKQYFLEESFDEVYKNFFLNEYIKLLYSMDKIEYFEESCEEGDNTINIYGAKVNLPSNNLNMNSAVLYLDGNTCVPIKLEILDSKGNLRILIEYLTFEFLEKIDSRLFEY